MHSSCCCEHDPGGLNDGEVFSVREELNLYLLTYLLHGAESFLRS